MFILTRNYRKSYIQPILGEPIPGSPLHSEEQEMTEHVDLHMHSIFSDGSDTAGELKRPLG